MFPFAPPESHGAAGERGSARVRKRHQSVITLALGRVCRAHVAQRVRQAVAIGAPREKVFAFLEVPENGLALIPQLVEVNNVVPLPDGGHRIQFVALVRRRKLCEWVSEPIE